MADRKSVVLVAFYNVKALGVRYLEKALADKGYDTTIVFFKGFNSVRPVTPTERELRLLCALIREVKPVLVGLSVMSSMYLDAVTQVTETIRKSTDVPQVWGGVYPTMFAKYCLQHGADYCIRGEGEQAICELADALALRPDATPLPGDVLAQIRNLSYMENDSLVQNELRPLCENLDELDPPRIGGPGRYVICEDQLSEGDPQLGALSYEIAASRGCPFVCSYCCAVSLKRIHQGKGTYVRFRSVDSVMSELKDAKSKLKRLKFIRFWDEIFSDEPNWIDDFVQRYKAEINLPFIIWGHPLKTQQSTLEKLVSCGLYEVVMGIQSGSPRVRKEVFHRVETQEDVLRAAAAISAAKVPRVSYDFMLQHPFETDDDIRETYELCAALPGRFELQLHGLNFLPGTDIVQMAIADGLYTQEALDEIMLSPMDKQFDMYWQRNAVSELSQLYYKLTFLTQFSFSKSAAARCAQDPLANQKSINRLYVIGRKMERARYYRMNGLLYMRGLFGGSEQTTEP